MVVRYENEVNNKGCEFKNVFCTKRFYCIVRNENSQFLGEQMKPVHSDSCSDIHDLEAGTGSGDPGGGGSGPSHGYGPYGGGVRPRTALPQVAENVDNDNAVAVATTSERVHRYLQHNCSPSAVGSEAEAGVQPPRGPILSSRSRSSPRQATQTSGSLVVASIETDV